jgi:hypothetical protein
MFTRRAFLLLLLALLSLDFGVSQFRMRHDTPPGWKTERWEAGVGSWCCGGYLVAYDISMPKNYNFTQKCGKAWVEGDDTMIDDFLIEFSFFGTSTSRYADGDFENYLRSGAINSAQSFGRHASDIRVASGPPYHSGAMRFSRADILLGGEVQPSDPAGKPTAAAARGFRLKGDQISIISELNAPSVEDINEKIIRSMRPVRGFSLFDILTGSVPFLNGC